MPQFKRSVAFSNKQKKEQLKARKERKKFVSSSDHDTNKPFVCFEEKKNASSCEGRKIPVPPSRKGFTDLKRTAPNSDLLAKSFFLDEIEDIGGAKSSKVNRYNLKFKKLNKDEGKATKNHYVPIVAQSQEELEVDSNTFFPSSMNYPKRPQWKKNMSKVELDQNENRSFRLFCEDMDNSFPSGELSLYELNLETWRQLWRVTEMSDILLIIVDARYSVAQFPPYLYKHLVERENKGVILILNKCDLLPPSLILAWQDYFIEKFPKIIVLPFSSFEGKEANKSKLKMATQSSLRLINACHMLVEGNVDLSSWRKKVKEEAKESYSIDARTPIQHEIESNKVEETLQKFRDGILTIGTIGHPNVGKSSLINALMGKKVVSVSRTPGHTKYFQTIFITKNIKLCDCPGLVFPSLCPRQLQVVIGSYPIAQVRDPLRSIHYIASTIDIPKLMNLRVLEAIQDEGVSEREFQWTPFHICEAWARKRCYFTRTKGARPDVFRAANELLRFTLVGSKSLIISLKPPGYSKKKDSYKFDERQSDIRLVQGQSAWNFECHLETHSEEESEDEDLDEEEEDIEDEDLDEEEKDIEEELKDESTESENEDSENEDEFHDAVEGDEETELRKEEEDKSSSPGMSKVCEQKGNKFSLLTLEDN